MRVSIVRLRVAKFTGARIVRIIVPLHMSLGMPTTEDIKHEAC